jgi:alkylated DNA repair dioxygenase AlkB
MNRHLILFPFLFLCRCWCELWDEESVQKWPVAVVDAFAAKKKIRTQSGRPPKTTTLSTPSLHITLQNSFTPQRILEDVARYLSPEIDPTGNLSSLTLVRLSKQCISLDNNVHSNNNRKHHPISLHERNEIPWNELQNAVKCLAVSDWSSSLQTMESAVEGMKAASVICRLLHSPNPNNSKGGSGHDECVISLCLPLVEKLSTDCERMSPIIEPHQLSGLKWAVDCFHLVAPMDMKEKCILPPILQDACDTLNLPFRIRPGFLSTDKFETDTITVDECVSQINFQLDSIRTTSNEIVTERRQTAWQGDDHVSPFLYSGKSMARMPWSPLVVQVRDYLHQQTFHYYDGCLLNLYPDGGSAMRYHIDPDQGSRWGYETAVVSIGATRRFAFRSIPTKDDRFGASKPHVFVLMHGDVTEMFSNCQERFQHCVKAADTKQEKAPRVSLVFKKTMDQVLETEG